MSFNVIASTIAGSSNANNVTTSALNTIGTTLIVVTATYYNLNGNQTDVITDSLSNTWTALTRTTSTDNSQVNRLWYCVNPTVGSSHTFTLASNIGGPSGNLYPIIGVVAASGNAASPYQAQSGAGGSGTSAQPGSITPTLNGALVVSGIAYGVGSSATINDGFTALTRDSATDSNQSVSGGLAYLIQSTAAAINPTWSWSSSQSCATNMAVFLPPALTLTPGSTSSLRSPGNWSSGGASRTITTTATSWTNGAWAEYHWSNTASTSTATLNVNNATSGSYISYFLDGALTDAVAVPTSGGISISVTGAGSHVVRYYCRNSLYQTRWALTNAYTDSGLVLDSTSTAGTAPAARPWVLIVGDSITEGTYANNGSDSNLCDYSFAVGQGLNLLGYDYCVSACGYAGFIEKGDGYGNAGDVPAYYPVSSGVYGGNANARWCQLDQYNSLLDSANQISSYGSTNTAPAIIYINYGTNECLDGAATSDLTTSIVGCLSALRGAAPNATIVVQIPFGLYNTTIFSTGGTYITAIKAGVSAYQAAHPSDTKVQLADFGAAVSNSIASSLYHTDSVHPNIQGHAYVSPQVMAVLSAILTANKLPNYAMQSAVAIQSGYDIQGFGHGF